MGDLIDILVERYHRYPAYKEESRESMIATIELYEKIKRGDITDIEDDSSLGALVYRNEFDDGFNSSQVSAMTLEQAKKLGLSVISVFPIKRSYNE